MRCFLAVRGIVFLRVMFILFTLDLAYYVICGVRYKMRLTHYSHFHAVWGFHSHFDRENLNFSIHQKPGEGFCMCVGDERVEFPMTRSKIFPHKEVCFFDEGQQRALECGAIPAEYLTPSQLSCVPRGTFPDLDDDPAMLSDDDDWHSCVSEFSSDYNDFDAKKYLSFIDYESDDSVESDAQESDVSIYYV